MYLFEENIWYFTLIFVLIFYSAFKIFYLSSAEQHYKQTVISDSISLKKCKRQPKFSFSKQNNSNDKVLVIIVIAIMRLGVFVKNATFAWVICKQLNDLLKPFATTDCKATVWIREVDIVWDENNKQINVCGQF